MPIAQIQSTVAGKNYPRATLCSYSDSTGVSASSTSAELIRLQIPGLVDDTGTATLPGHSKLMRLTSVASACDSTDYDIILLDKNDISALNTINEIYSYTGVNLSYIDVNLETFIVSNHDTTKTNELYLYIKNDDTTNATGTINFVLGFELYY